MMNGRNPRQLTILAQFSFFAGWMLLSFPVMAACERAPERDTARQVLQECGELLKHKNLPVQDRARAHFWRGKAFMLTRRMDRAVAAFTSALMADPGLDMAYNWRGVAEVKRRQPERAISDLNIYIKRRPEAVEGYVNRGTVFSIVQRPDEAFADFQTAAKLDPQHPGAIRGLAGIHQRGEFRQAIAAYSKLIAIQPRGALGYANRGLVLADSGDYPAAMRDYDSALERNPKLDLAYWGRCWAHGLLGNGSAALADCARASRRGRGWDASVLLPRAIAHYRLGRLDVALSEVERAITHAGIREWRAYAIRAVILRNMGDISAAERDRMQAGRILGQPVRLAAFMTFLGQGPSN